MRIDVMRARLHRITITEADLNYIGSITLDTDLIDAAGLVPGEKVQIVNCNNGERIETYVIEGERGSGRSTEESLVRGVPHPCRQGAESGRGQEQRGGQFLHRGEEDQSATGGEPRSQ